VSQTAVRHVVAVVHVVPFGSPHFPSALHLALRQTVAVAHARLFGSPQSSSLVSQTPLAQTRVPTAVVHTPPMGADGGTGWPFAIFTEHAPPPGEAVGLSHHSPGQSASTVQAVPQTPLAVLQRAPACVPLEQSAFDVHLPHAPVDDAQYGSAAEGQACDAAEPLSPLQATHPFVATLHTGVVVVHAPGLAAVQVTHWLVVVLQTRPLWQSVSAAHGSHLPALAPLVAQTPARHWALLVQGPWPAARPHSLSVSQTPVVQTALPVAVVQVPPCSGSFGIGLPSARVGVQASVVPLQ